MAATKSACRRLEAWQGRRDPERKDQPDESGTLRTDAGQRGSVNTGIVMSEHVDKHEISRH